MQFDATKRGGGGSRAGASHERPHHDGEVHARAHRRSFDWHRQRTVVLSRRCVKQMRGFATRNQVQTLGPARGLLAAGRRLSSPRTRTVLEYYSWI